MSGDAERELLLLIDECDAFFEEDARQLFAETRKLKELYESSGHRVKPIFAGLHQVQRFATVPNQPFAHLGRPEPIGPLSPLSALHISYLFEALCVNRPKARGRPFTEGGDSVQIPYYEDLED